MAERYDVAILGGGARGAHGGAQIKRARPETSVLLLEKRKGPAPLAARSRWGESTPRAERPLFRQRARPARPSRCRARPQARPAVLLHRRGQPGRRAASRMGAARLSRARLRASRSTEGGSRTSSPTAAARAAWISGTPASRTWTSPGDADHTVTFTEDGDEKAASARWVVGATGRASLIRRKLGLERRSTTRSTRHGFDSRGTQDRRLVRRPGLAGRMFDPIRWMHEPPHGPGVLGLAHPAVVGRDQHRHRRGPPSIRSSASTRSRPPSTGSTSTSPWWLTRSDPAPTTSRTSSRSSTTRTAPSACSRPTAGADRRRRGLRPVLFTRIGLHRARQRVHHRPGAARSVRTARRAARRRTTRSTSRSSTAPSRPTPGSTRSGATRRS